LNSISDSSIKQEFSTSLQTIKQILDNVENDKKTVVTYTNDTIDKQIANYKQYLDTITLEKQNIQKYLNEQSSIGDDELSKNKTELQKKITEFNDLHNNINNLLNNLTLTDDQKQNYETQILENYNSVDSIKLSVPNETNNESVLSDIQRVNDLIQMDEVVQKDLQTIELDAALPPAESPPPQSSFSGGAKKKKWSTKNLIEQRKKV